MDLLPYAEADRWLTEAIECDPEMMKEVGGPISPDEVEPLHRKRLGDPEWGNWWLTIVPDASTGPIGTIGIWEAHWKGELIHESGWMILKAFQGRGLAKAALRMLLERARSDGRFERIHAFPARTNAPSNALCEKTGFVMVEECEFEFRGKRLECNHWLLTLSGASR